MLLQGKENRLVDISETEESKEEQSISPGKRLPAIQEEEEDDFEIVRPPNNEVWHTQKYET